MINSTFESSQKIKPISVPISDLRGYFDGQVIAPEDAEYDKARSSSSGGIDHRPDAIIRVKDTADISRVVSLARETEMELAIHSGGHSIAGHSVSNGGITLDLSKMKALQIDVKERTAWAETGLTAGEYTIAASAHGLATPFGDTATVGIGGLTLGGGVGYLVRKYGLTIDSLIAAEIVTADGNLLHVDANSHPHLFWAIRGGGGNFGVVTRFKFRLHDVDRIVGGMLVLPATPDVLTAFIAKAETAPDELSAIVNVMTAPPMPFLPKEVYGKPILMASLAYAGDVADGENIIAPFRALAKPLADMVRPMRYAELFPHEDNDYHPLAASHTMFIDALDHATTQMVLDEIGASSASMAIVQLLVLGGVVARVPVDATAYTHRKSRIMVYMAALYENPEQGKIYEEWVANLATALKQSDDGAYVNFLGKVDEASIRAAYPGSAWERLREVKKRYDPTNLFHLNQNIPPENGE